MNEWNDRIDLPSLQSITLGNEAFRNTPSFVMTNLTSLESIEFGNYCFGGYYNANWDYNNGASSFSLIGMID